MNDKLTPTNKFLILHTRFEQCKISLVCLCGRGCKKPALNYSSYLHVFMTSDESCGHSASHLSNVVKFYCFAHEEWDTKEYERKGIYELMNRDC